MVLTETQGLCPSCPECGYTFNVDNQKLYAAHQDETLCDVECLNCGLFCEVRVFIATYYIVKHPQAYLTA